MSSDAIRSHHHWSGIQDQHLNVVAMPVNHIVPTVGLIVADEKTTIAFSSDTAETQEFWDVVNGDHTLMLC